MPILFRKKLSTQPTCNPILGLLQIYRKKRSRYFEIHFPRFVLLLLLAASLTYLGLGTALFLREQRNPFTEVTFSDIIFPWNWPQMVEKRRGSYLKEGLAAYDEGRFREALFLLRIGVRHQPENHVARIRLANLLRLLQQTDQAISIVLDGLNHGLEQELDAVRYCFMFLGSDFRYERAIDLARQIVANPKTPAEVKQFCARYESSALMRLRNWQDLREAAAASKITFPQDALFPVYEAFALNALGDSDAARQILRTNPILLANTRELNFAEILLSIHQGLTPFSKLSIDAYLSSPVVPPNYKVHILDELYLANNPEEAEFALQQFLTLHRTDLDAITILVNTVAGKMRPETAELLFEICSTEHPVIAPSLVNLVVQSAGHHRDPSFLQDFSRRRKAFLTEEPVVRFLGWLESFDGFLRQGGTAHAENLVQRLSIAPPPPSTFLALANMLRQKGHPKTAGRVAELGSAKYPGFKPLVNLYSEITEPGLLSGLHQIGDL
ncbi:MAG: tetratricopeptide repeat protein [Puniceicoccaceae bacterium]